MLHLRQKSRLRKSKDFLKAFEQQTIKGLPKNSDQLIFGRLPNYKLAIAIRNG